MLTIVLAAQGILGGTYAASAAYLATGLHGETLARSLAMMQGSARVALAAAPALAGLAASFMGVREMYGIAALLPLGAAAVTMALPAPSSEPRPDTIVAFRAGPPLLSVRALCLAEAGFVLATVVTFPYFLPLAERLLPSSSAALGGLLFAAPHVCYLLFAVPAMRVLRDHARLGLAIGYALAAASAVVHLVPVLLDAAALPWLIAGRLLLGAALTCGLTSLSVLAARCAAGRAPGRLFGLVEACSKGGAVLAGAAASALATFGPAAPLWVAVLSGVALSCVLSVARRPEMSVL